MRVLGIDPGTGRCGFGIVEKHGNRIVPINYGVIETFKEQNSLERLNIVYEGVAELIEMYRPHFMGVESLYLLYIQSYFLLEQPLMFHLINSR